MTKREKLELIVTAKQIKRALETGEGVMWAAFRLDQGWSKFERVLPAEDLAKLKRIKARIEAMPVKNKIVVSR